MNNRYLDAKGLARVANLEFIARQVVEGFVSGRHRSPYHGFSVEYADHRQYTQGDEIRTIDWKVLARTNKCYVKLFEEETNLRAYLLLDASRSMAFGGDPKTGRLNKYDYGAYTAAALAYLLVRQSDAVGLGLFDSALRIWLPPRASPVQFRRIVNLLGENTSESDTAVGEALHRVAERIPRSGLVILISDLLDSPESLVGGLQHLRHRKHEIVVFHLIDPAERVFPFDRMSRFRDMEGSGELIANPASLRAKYLERLERFLDSMSDVCSRNKVSYHLLQTDDPYERALGGFLEKRARLG